MFDGTEKKPRPRAESEACEAPSQPWSYTFADIFNRIIDVARNDGNREKVLRRHPIILFAPVMVSGGIDTVLMLLPQIRAEGAKPSLSHMLVQSLHVTRSPNHWWAISCERRLSAASDFSAARSACTISQRGERRRAHILHAGPQRSCPPPSCAYFSQGYATPYRSEKKSSICFVWLNVESIVSSIPRGT